MYDRVRLFLIRLGTKLWMKPLLYCLLAVASVFVARGADLLGPGEGLPDIDEGTIAELMSILSTTMLSVATFAVGAMVGAYASAGDNATPRAFELIVSDNLSKTALSSFLGAFIFSVVGTVALETEIYGQAGRFVLFVISLAVIAWIVITFVRWVDDIARLGRMQTAVDRAENAARECLKQRRKAPHLGGQNANEAPATGGMLLCTDRIGYVQFIKMDELQEAAEEADLRLVVEALPGSFATPDRPLARLLGGEAASEDCLDKLRAAFVIGDERTFETDPRFGMIVLSEIAQRALSPGVNDPGTAIVIVGRMVRLLAYWLEPDTEAAERETSCDRIFVPGLKLGDLFDDAFTPLARDGAHNVQFGLRLQKAFASLASLGDPEARVQAIRHARYALSHAEAAFAVDDDIEPLRAVAHGIDPEGTPPAKRAATSLPQP